MNTLSVNLQHSIVTLAAGKRSQRDIAKLLGIHRETVGRYLRLEASKPAEVPLGSETGCEAKPAKLPAGSEMLEEPKPAKVPASIFPLSRSQCEAWREQMEPWIQTGLTAQRIYQDLVGNHGCADDTDQRTDCLAG